MPAGIKWDAKTANKVEVLKDAKRSTDKIRLGVIVGKAHDPIVKGSQIRDYPERLKIKNNSGPNATGGGWGGSYQIDVQMGMTIRKLHPDVFDIDFITGPEINSARLAKNHLNINLCYDMVCATMTGDSKHIAAVKKAFSTPSCRLWPEYDLQDFVYDKTRYLQACEKADIPIIPTVYVMEGFDHKDILKKAQEKGWDRFFVKPGAMGSFGLAAFNGKLKDLLKDPTPIKEYEDALDKDNYRTFLVQPYMNKPDGKVFDEIRHFFIDGEYAYAVYTDGTDDNAVRSQPEGPVLEATKVLAHQAYQELLKVAKWRGQSFVPPISRVDIGMVPIEGKPLEKGRLFVNEIEMEAATWLVRYCPFDLVTRMGEVYVTKLRDLLAGLEAAGEKLPNPAVVKKLCKVLDERAEQSSAGTKRKQSATESLAPKKVRAGLKCAGA